MARKYCYSAVLLVVMAAATVSCSTNDPGRSADVYISGSIGETAVYWKNGTVVPLAIPINAGSTAADILVVGADVYVAGTLSASLVTAVCWKNGVMTALSDNTSHATAIASNGRDIFIAGFINGTSSWKSTTGFYWKNGTGGYWKNGTFTQLANCTNGNDIAVSGSDVYVVGTLEPPPDTAIVPALWKNGVLTTLSGTDGLLHIAVGSSGVYVCGNVTTQYLQNGSEMSLPNTITINAVAVSGPDVYVAGIASDSPGSAEYAAYWKNGVISKLDNAATPARIRVSGADVYVIGNFNNPDASNTPVYWKNGVSVSLPPSGAPARVSGLCLVR